MFVDMHIHTYHSDGKLSVNDTIKWAAEKNISILSITDHDSTMGVPTAIELARSLRMTCVSGIELSCRNENKHISFPDDISVHLLAYNIDYSNFYLKSYLQSYYKKRKDILLSLIDELAIEGFETKYDDIHVIAGTQMRIQDIINHINSTFMCKEKKERFLTIANGYYNNLFAIDSPLEDAIKLIREAGGLPVLAHAFFSYRDYEIVRNKQSDLVDLLDYLCDLGIYGVEAYYSKFSTDQTEWLTKEANRRNLKITAGSDFHGTNMRKEMMNYDITEIKSTIRHILSQNRYS